MGKHKEQNQWMQLCLEHDMALDAAWMVGRNAASPTRLARLRVIAKINHVEPTKKNAGRIATDRLPVACTEHRRNHGPKDHAGCVMMSLTGDSAIAFYSPCERSGAPTLDLFAFPRGRQAHNVNHSPRQARPGKKNGIETAPQRLQLADAVRIFPVICRTAASRAKRFLPSCIRRDDVDS